MSKLTLTEAVKVLPVSESTLRRDMKSGKVSFETDAKGRKQIDVSELTRVYGQLQASDPSNNTHQKTSMNGNETATLPFLAENDGKVVTLLEAQVQDLKAQLASAETEKQQLLELANGLQKQNAVLMLPPPREKSGWVERLKSVFRTQASL
ncbi:hypothetical protein J5I95_19455 [Candidatus Poribacteria bacterium]|nr:hypothetical protein [Candidatus Poribacteria bacterium]